MGMRNLMSDTKKKLEIASSGSSKLENERQLNKPPEISLEKKAMIDYLRAKAQQNKPALPTTDMGMKEGIEKARIMEEYRKKKESNMPDWMKPQFRINSLDRQNNDPLRTGSIDSFRGNTDIKPLPAATFSGSVAKIPNLTMQ